MFIDETTGKPYTVQYRADGSMVKTLSDGRRLIEHPGGSLTKGSRDCAECSKPHDADSKAKFCADCGHKLPPKPDDDAEVQKALRMARRARAGDTDAIADLVKSYGGHRAADLMTGDAL